MDEARKKEKYDGHVAFSLKRIVGESFTKYRERLRVMAKVLKIRHRFGRRFVPIEKKAVGPNQIRYSPPGMKPHVISKKIHAGESVMAFRERRRLSNKRRRQREMEYRHGIS